DRFFLPLLQPVVPRHQVIVLVGLAIPRAPVSELARRELDPLQQLLVAELAAFRPMPHEVDQLVPDVVGDPCRVQSSPRSFFKRRCSSRSSLKTSGLVWRGDWRAWISFSC